MGAATHHFPADRPLTEKDRVAAVHAALADGTVARIRDLMGWSTADLAERMNVLPSLVEGWLSCENPRPRTRPPSCGPSWCAPSGTRTRLRRTPRRSRYADPAW